MDGGRSKKTPSSKSSNKTKKRKRSRKRSGNNRDLASSPSLDLVAAGGDGDLHSMLEDATETVVANLVYDERLGDFVEARRKGRTRGGLRIESSSEDDLDIEELPEEEKGGEGASKKGSASNVFRAFERARGVDELFRVAEIWVNPESYGIHRQAEKS